MIELKFLRWEIILDYHVGSKCYDMYSHKREAEQNLQTEEKLV